MKEQRQQFYQNLFHIKYKYNKTYLISCIKL